MKKIGIVTLHGYNNYGNRLQNYALLYVLEKMGTSVTTTIINVDKKTALINNIKHTIMMDYKYLNKKIKQSIFKDKKNISTQDSVAHKKRVNTFKEFSNMYLNEQIYPLSNQNSDGPLEEFDYFITGSDQVWNPSIYKLLDIYFLTFTPTEKRIAYAPSISRNFLSNKYKKSYSIWLNGMSCISVREEAGAKIIKDLIGADVPVLADPTMLLTKNEWLSISKRATNRPDTPYLLTYFLGGPSEEVREKLENIAKDKNMKVINLADISEKETYETGPSEFLDYINNASAFFTDSFHGVVFSIVFQKPFIVYERLSSGPSMYSRIETILDKFDMRDREAKDFDEDIFSMDFSGSQEVLDREYDKSINYLKEALRIEE